MSRIDPNLLITLVIVLFLAIQGWYQFKKLRQEAENPPPPRVIVNMPKDAHPLTPLPLGSIEQPMTDAMAVLWYTVFKEAMDQGCDHDGAIECADHAVEAVKGRF
jgi:hypothetical protein